MILILIILFCVPFLYLAQKTLLEEVNGGTILVNQSTNLSKKKLILTLILKAFGDSLTHGLCFNPVTNQYGDHPYSIRLQELLSNQSTTVIESGISK